MPPIRSIAILLHERHQEAERMGYRIWALAENWKRRGIRIELVRGPAREIDTDLLIPHLDLSYIPDRYWDMIQGHPNVVNQRIRDTRKRAISANLVSRADPHVGPVIVKTNCNCGGLTDALLNEPDRPWTFARRLRRRLSLEPWLERRMLGSARVLRRYHLFESMGHVPRRVYRNPNLVIEKFLPERRGDLYVIRMYTFFGGSERVRVLESSDPQVKSGNGRLRERSEVPPQLRAWRERLGLDYGKIDFVMRDGEPVVIDVNTTPTMSSPLDEDRVRRSSELADGLSSFQRARCSPAAPGS
ncbi:MAG: hypothetical protein H6811_07950 [Phycisphaeraceae bacterium]|nr:hypothetical protein [Phycisphaeraceae bacterium]